MVGFFIHQNRFGKILLKFYLFKAPSEPEKAITAFLSFNGLFCLAPFFFDGFQLRSGFINGALGNFYCQVSDFFFLQNYG
jgi:hypothetical protein